MNRQFLSACLLILILLISGLFAADRGVVKVIPAPDFPYGLTFDGTYLWVGTSYANSGGDYIWKIDPADGSVAGTIPIPEPNQFYKIKGLAWDGQYLWVFEDLSSTPTDKFYKVDPNTGAVLKSFDSPHKDYVGGMTYADGHIWFSQYYASSGQPKDILIKMDTTGVTVDTIVTVGEQPMGVAYDGQFVWCVEDTGYGANRQEIYKYDPGSGTYTGEFIRCPDENPRDMTWDGQYFWMIGYHSTNSVIYQIDVQGGTPIIHAPVTELDFGLVSLGDTLTYGYNITNQGTASLSLDTLIFNNPAFFSNVNSFPVDIPPGQGFAFQVSFAPIQLGPVQGIMSIHSNDPSTPVVDVTLKGQGQNADPTIWLSESSHNFGNVWVPAEGKAKWLLRIANIGNQNLEIVDLILNQPEFSVGGFTGYPIIIAPNDTFKLSVFFQPSDTLTYLDTLTIASTDPASPFKFVPLTGKGILENYNTGYTFWQYQVPPNPSAGSYQEFEVDGLQTINDITGDGIGEVVIATENYWLLCLDGAASGLTDTLWSFSSYISNYSAGSIGGNLDYGVQDAIDIASDLNGDGFNDVVIGTGGGNEHTYAIDGTNGNIIWQFGTDDPNSYGLGDFQAVDAQRDFNGDQVPDVLAIADGNQQGTGYKSAYLFNGTNGNIIWSYQYPGPAESFGKTIISIDDINGDSKPDAVIAVSNNGSSADYKTYALDGQTGFPIWDHTAIAYGPKELVELPVAGQTPDVVVAEYFGAVQRLDGETGTAMWTYSVGGLSGNIQMQRIADVNNDGTDDIVLAQFTSAGVCISGADGNVLWAVPMDFQYGVSPVPDLNSDGIEDVIMVAGTNNPTNGTFYCISGKGDSLLFTHSFTGDRPHSVNVLPSIDGNDSYELLVGTKFGQVLCFSGGLNPTAIEDGLALLPGSYTLAQNYPNPFNPTTTLGFNLPGKAVVTLKVFNLLGQEVRTLLKEKPMPSGVHRITFDAAGLPSGMYLYRLESRFGVLSGKMMLMK